MERTENSRPSASSLMDKPTHLFCLKGPLKLRRGLEGFCLGARTECQVCCWKISLASTKGVQPNHLKYGILMHFEIHISDPSNPYCPRSILDYCSSVALKAKPTQPTASQAEAASFGSWPAATTEECQAAVVAPLLDLQPKWP